MTEILAVSSRELSRATILGLVAGKQMSLTAAAERLGVSLRQARRLQRRFEHGGAKALIHKLRGRPAPNRLDLATALQVLELAQTDYLGFNDSHLREALAEREGIVMGRETLRRLLRRAGVLPKHRRRPRQHRRRRDPSACPGLMVQWDGSTHGWLGRKGPKWTLMAAVDDADSRCLAGFFVPGETSVAYLRLLEGIVRGAGIPHSIYQDRHGALRRNDGSWSLEEQLAGQQNPTQVGAALRDLEIQPIFAHCPQGKGRIERFFGVAQDRLIAELAHHRITSIEEANDFLRNHWIADFNRRFGRPPQKPVSAYRPLGKTDLNKCLAFRYSRVVAADNTVRLGDLCIQLPPASSNRSRASRRVDVRQHLDGSWTVYDHDKPIAQHPTTPLREPDRVRVKTRNRKRSGCKVHDDLLVYLYDDLTDSPSPNLSPSPFSPSTPNSPSLTPSHAQPLHS
jgi:transposase